MTLIAYNKLYGFLFIFNKHVVHGTTQFEIFVLNTGLGSIVDLMEHKLTFLSYLIFC